MSLFYPDQLWRFVPTSIDEWDTALQAEIRNEKSPFWVAVKWFSDTPEGISFCIFLVFTLWWYFGGPATRGRLLKGFLVFLVLALFIGVSDFIAHKGLKIPIGRLKPRVNGIIPGFYQALSFPSNHALNMSFAISLFWMISKVYFKRTLKFLNRFLVMTLPILFLVSLSRIALNEHYPLDIIFGWLLGFLLALALFPLFYRCTAWILKKAKVDSVESVSGEKS